MDFERSSRSMKEISLVPLINVVFLLLIFFLVAGTVEKIDIVPVELPEAISGQVLDEGRITVVLGRYDEILINDELVTATDIEALIAKQLVHNPERIITIKADSQLAAEKMIAVMDRIKMAGGRNLSVITQSGVE